MRPEVVGAFRLAMKHEEKAGTLGGLRRRAVANKREHDKAEKLYQRARRLEARGMR